MQVLFALTLLVSASLLFFVQPMFAKMVLPRLGGTPAVWNTCMVFYQAVLLAGYLYAHLSTRWLGTRRQAVVHLGLLCLPWLVLPIGLAAHWNPPTGENPIPWLLLLMSVTVGLPFFVVSASAPMLQAWFADTGHPSGRDPYFLYAASNLGSMAALLGYPFLVEPYLPLAGQAWWWAAGYAMLVGLTLSCALALWWSPGKLAVAAAGASGQAVDVPTEEAAEPAAPTFALRMRWLALSFAPSSLLLGVTTFISTDIASVPLLWVIPLALYLLTFVLVFARWTILPHRLMVWTQPFLVVLLTIVFFQTTSSWMQWLVLLHLVTFFVTAMVCHGELARSRPSTVYLTEFYIWMSVGGVLGGLFNALVAPRLFHQVLEYPLVVAVACMLRPTLLSSKPATRVPRWKAVQSVTNAVKLFFTMVARKTGLHRVIALGGRARCFARRPGVARWLDLLLPMLLLAALIGLYGLYHPGRINKIPTRFGGTEWHFERLNWLGGLNSVLEWIRQHLPWPSGDNGRLGEFFRSLGTTDWRLGLETAILTLGAMAAFAFQARPVRFGFGVLVVLTARLMLFGAGTNTIYEERSFFGVVRVREDVVDLDNATKRIEHTLVHGSTNHGAQWAEISDELADKIPNRRDLWAKAKKGRTPITYYFRTGPVGQVFTRLADPVQTREIGVIGLGTGTTAAWAKPGQRVTYFEIDPMVKRISYDSARLFSYVTDAEAHGVPVAIEMGDARITLEDDERVPPGKFDILIVDAFSSDAIPIHLLTKEAIEVYFRKLSATGILLVHVSNRHLELAPVVGNLARELGLVCRICRDDTVSDEDEERGKFASDWVILVRKEKRLGSLATNSKWKPIPPDDRVGIWTDDFSNVVDVLRWFRSRASADASEGDEEDGFDE